MSGDVTIPRETAQEVAETLRRQLLKYADLLDPPQPSLREEVAHSLLLNIREDRTGRYAADAVLALVRKRVLNLPRHEWGEGGWNVRLDDLVALFEEAR